MIAQFSIPGKPVAWARVGRAHGKGSFTPPHQRNFGALVKLAAEEAMAGAPPHEGAVSLTIAVCLPIARSWSPRKQAEAACRTLRPTGRPDWDNAGKIISDALNGIVWRDDAQVVEAKVSKFYDLVPRVDVLVCPIAAVQPTTFQSSENGE